MRRWRCSPAASSSFPYSDRIGWTNGSLKRQKNGLEREIERERILLGELPELSMQILEMCRERGRITIGEASKVTGISRITIKDHVAALAENGHLVRHGAGRGTWYSKTPC